MFANSFQSGFLSIFYSVGSSPLELWDKQVKNGHIRRLVDDEIKSLVLEISGTNVATTYITSPVKPRASLGVKLPFLVMIIKNMNKYFTFEIQILDDRDMRRRFRVSNFQSTTKVRPFCTTMPIGLSKGWNQVQFNLADFTKRAYGSTYLETQRVQIHANVRIRRIYFADQLYSNEDLPKDFKLFVPTAADKRASVLRKEQDKQKGKKDSPDEIVPSGAPPTPMESPRLEDDYTEPAEEPIEELPEPTGEEAAAGEGEEAVEISSIQAEQGEPATDVEAEEGIAMEGEDQSKPEDAGEETEGEGEGGDFPPDEGESVPHEGEVEGEHEVSPETAGEGPSEPATEPPSEPPTEPATDTEGATTDFTESPSPDESPDEE